MQDDKYSSAKMLSSCCRPQAGNNSLSPRTRTYFWDGGSFYTNQKSLLGFLCCAPQSLCIPGVSPSLRQLVTNRDCLFPLPNRMSGSKGASYLLCAHRLVAPSSWKQLSVDTLITYPGHDTWHMSYNWLPCYQPLSLLFLFFLPGHQSDCFKLRLKNTQWLPITYRMSLILWWAPERGCSSTLGPGTMRM